MRKKLMLTIMTGIVMAILTGCHINHDWQEATCTTPRTCLKGGETEGDALGHTWIEATCITPKTCSVCGETEGDALEHTWIEADYENPKTCSICGTTEGEKLKPFDASAYTKAILDNSYKNDSTDFVSMNLGTAEEAFDIYEQGLDAEVDALLASTGSISYEQAQEFKQVFADILAGVKYTVGEAEMQDDNSYVVTITYEQMQIFGPAMEAYMAKVTDMANTLQEAVAAGEDFPSDDELTAMIVDLLKDCFVDALPNATYAEPETTTIRVELVNNEYTLNESDISNLELILIDTSNI